MQLPQKNEKVTAKSHEFIRNSYNPGKAPWVLSAIALCFGVVSMAFAGYIYATQPQQINAYVQAHKNELKGDKGDVGDMGPRGFSGANGSNSYSPTHCSSYGYGDYTSTNCY